MTIEHIFLKLASVVYFFVYHLENTKAFNLLILVHLSHLEHHIRFISRFLWVTAICHLLDFAMPLVVFEFSFIFHERWLLLFQYTFSFPNIILKIPDVGQLAKLLVTKEILSFAMPPACINVTFIFVSVWEIHNSSSRWESIILKGTIIGTSIRIDHFP